MIFARLRFVTVWLAGLAAAGLSGCQPASAPAVAISTAGVQPSADIRDLSSVLQKCVRKGKLVETALRKHAGGLDAQLARLAVTGPTATPTLFPTADSRLAYWYNARAAWSLKLALLADCPDTIRRAKLEDRPFPLDGREMTLAGIDAVLAGDPDWRAAVAAPSIRRNEPGLPEQAFEAAAVRAEVERRLQDYLGDTERFQIDLPRKQVVFPPALWAVREKLIQLYRQKLGGIGATPITALLPYARGRAERRLQDAIGYRVVPQRETGLIALLTED